MPKSIQDMVKINFYHPFNDKTAFNKQYNSFFFKLLYYLKKHFEVHFDGYFEEADTWPGKPVTLVRYPTVKINLLECECIIENIHTGQFVFLSVADSISTAAITVSNCKYLQVALLSQFDPMEIYTHTGPDFYKFMPWTYFIDSPLLDLDSFYYNRELIPFTSLRDILFFKGTVDDRKILSHFSSDTLSDVTIIPDREKYFTELIKYKAGLSVAGRGEICYRDMEYFGCGVPMIRFEYLSKLTPRLLPDYHYISVPRTEDLVQCKWGDVYHAQLLEQKFLEVKDDKDFLTFISNNARKYYEDNISMKAKVENTYNLAQLDSWKV